MTTPYGKAVRKLRIDAGVRLKDMADALGVKSAYLSAVETGKKRITESLLTKSIDYLSGFPCHDRQQVRDQLTGLVSQSQPDCNIPLKGRDDADRELVVAFARKFSDLSERKKQDLKSLLDMD